jgi:3D (Asp-Asp-Asp) domain-containing protein
MLRLFQGHLSFTKRSYAVVLKLGIIVIALLTPSASVLWLHNTSGQTTSFDDSANAKAPIFSEAFVRGSSGEINLKGEGVVGLPTTYVATAYSLRGRTASGRTVAKGLIAADPRHLPLGSRVRLEAGAYSGEYLVSDTSTLMGKHIEIWQPTPDEAQKFGRRRVMLTLLSTPNRSPVVMREELETKFLEKKITYEEYQTRCAELQRLLAQTVKASAQYYVRRPNLYESATYMPAKFGPIDPNEKTLLDTYHERFRLEMDIARKVVSEAEYAERLAAIVKEENLIARNGALNGSEMVRYYENTAKIQPSITLFKNTFEKRESWSFESVFKLTTILLAILGTALTFYLSKKKDVREKKLLEFETRKLELAEISSRETIEKTRLLLETKQYQIKEMSLRIAQLEQQLGKAGKKLVIP